MSGRKGNQQGEAEYQMSIGDAMFKYMTVKGGDELIGVGSYYHRTDNSQYNGNNTTNYAPAYSFSTGAAHLTVDEETGVLDIDEFVFAHDCGRALNKRPWKPAGGIHRHGPGLCCL